MNMDLESYVKVYNDWIGKDKCMQSIDELQNSSWSQHMFYNASDGSFGAISGDKELDVSSDVISTNPYLMERTWLGIQKYILELNFSWFDGWNGHSKIRFNRYKDNQLMALHCDHISSTFDGKRKGVPVLSVLGILNDNYEGGSFIMWDKEIKLKAGDLLIFPSSFLYPHKVESVTKGERYTFVSWVW